mmetsp:Transcript_129887/g.296105  ORF Transcript_129887/g.296105 Transcript_129887/m.296105 type:complete len:518 (-) Transcript_129887:138-1691(-)|eukprot:CAMPEP_0204337496 /NCGR_PEP_ID=MMETSP0469-20131031/20354_1 /ASSEMBLY_ACC=CAM_ASM_000384 /TAXON_ID=2969 /ORGANISM="Oxyrrhis marina" /LENGTH=517 /DNA_ID=CAMNT_0051321531 /DNA_START=10 /DNA_END=1563 /DNA_ORIENTATION=-
MDMDHRMLGDGGEPRDYLWIVVIGGFLAVFCAYGIGANDVANAFATSVGAKTLSVKHAVILAAIFEFGGAVLLGSHVTKTIRKGIADIDCFIDDGPVLMYGMMCVIFCTGLWLLIATFFQMPVSTTHSVVGGIIGMTIAAKGGSCVVWHKDTDQFPFVKGVSAIVVSWILSPLFSGVGAAILYLFVRTFILRSENSYTRAFIFYPFLLASAITLYTFFTIYKGAKGLDLDETPLSVATGVSFGIGFGLGLLSIPCMPILKKSIEARLERRATAAAAGTEEGKEAPADDKVTDDKAALVNGSFLSRSFSKFKNFLDNGINNEVHASLDDDIVAAGIHDTAEKFEERTEEVFKALQVFTACCDAFGHGANDVANSIGPYAAIYIIYTDNEVVSSRDLGADAYWILFLGGLGIVLGLATYGYKIMSAIGVQISRITPSRGFCIEMGATVIIVMGSRLEMPLSTTHCQVGATMGVALVERVGGLNWKLLGKVAFGWVATLAVVGFFSAILFCQGAYAPCAI